jgi:hypothetical protein
VCSELPQLLLWIHNLLEVFEGSSVSGVNRYGFDDPG